MTPEFLTVFVFHYDNSPELELISSKDVPLTRDLSSCLPTCPSLLPSNHHPEEENKRRKRCEQINDEMVAPKPLE